MPLMTLTIGTTRLEILRGDITLEKSDAIVNAANTQLAGGGGVDGAIHRAGGPSIMEECRKLRRCPTGHAVRTSAGNLRATWVIHAVGPIYTGLREDASQLASAYRDSLQRALEAGARTVSFPSISTGAYGYPVEAAAPIAISTVASVIKDKPDAFDCIRFVLFTDKDYAAYFGEFSDRGGRQA